MTREPGLVTVVGPGGVGKTALAASFLATGDRSSVFVDLRSVAAGANEHAVLAAIAREFRVDEAGSHLTEVLEQVLPDLGIVVLDNCEHAVDAVASVAAWLRVWVAVLCTSREPLTLPGERLIRLGPLETRSTATALFADRASVVDPTFRVDEHLEEVRRICSAVGGLPLGIELAASRIGAVQVDDLAERLEVSTRVLRNAQRGARDLDAALRWSIDALDEEQRSAAAALAVFAQEFDLGAAEAVSASTPDTIAALVERSILSRHGSTYLLLMPIQQLLRNLRPTADDVHERYARYVIEVFRAVERRGTAAERADADRHDADVDQVFDWLCAQDRLEAAAELCVLVNRVGASDLRRPERQARSLLAAGALSPAGAARALAVVARAANEDGRIAEAIQTSAEAVAHARSSGDASVLALALTYRSGPGMDEALEEVMRMGPEAAGAHAYYWATALLGRRYGEQLRIPEAVELLEGSAESARRGAPLSRQAVLLEFLGLAYVWNGRPRDARAAFDDALEHAHAPSLRAVITSGRGLDLTLLGEVTAGLEMLRAAHDELLERGARSMLSWLVELYADALLHAGQVEASAALLGGAVERGYEPSRARRAVQLATRLELLADFPGAGAAIQRAEQELERVPPRLLVELETVKAALTHRQGDPHGARARLLRAAQTAADGGAMPAAMATLERLALVCWDEGRTDEAAIIRRCVEQQRRMAGIVVVTDRLSFVPVRDEGPVSIVEVLRLVTRARRRRAAAAFGWESLTPTEREVARLVAAGATNAGVADKLLISPGTAKVHVSRILTKLGLRSRVEVAAVVLSRPAEP